MPSFDHRQPPRTLSRRLRRSGLVDRFVNALGGQIVLIQAAAGFGKTELMAAAYMRLRDRGEAVAWLTLSPGDEPTSVAAAIAAALESDAESCHAVLHHLHRRTEPFYLFLDAAEQISGRPDVIEWLLTNMPACMRLALAGRRLPQLRVSPFRLRGLLHEFGCDDLVYSSDEIRQLLGPWLSTADQENLGRVLGAWPALVSLAAQVFSSRPGPVARAKIMEGRHAVLRDFILQEALESVSPIGMAVLRVCAELPNFTMEIAADLAGLKLDEATLSEIESLPPLIIHEGQQIGWYRMHPIVAQVMQLVSGSVDTAEIRSARHARAANLFAQRGLLEKSVLHALLSGDYALAVETIERAGGVNVFLRSGYTVLHSIVQAVPHEVVRQTPSLRLCRALMLAKSGRIRDARLTVVGLIEETRNGLIQDEPNWVAVLDHISHLIDVYEDSALDEAGVAELEAMAEKERRENTWRLGWLFNNLTIAHTRRGDFQKAQICALNALSCYQEERSSYPQAFMLIHLSFINLRANRIDAALTHGKQAETIIRSRPWNDQNLLSILTVPLSSAHYLQGAVIQAEQMLERAMAVLAAGEGWVDFYVEGFGTLARAKMGLSGYDAAHEILQMGLEVANARDLDRLRLSITILQMELLVRGGRLDAAASIARQLIDLTDWPTDRERREAALAIARLDLRLGKLDLAAARLDPLADECKALGHDAMLLRVSLLQTNLAWALKDMAGALAALHQAAVLALPSQQVQQFHDEGPELALIVRDLTRKAGLSRISRQTADYLARTAGSVRSRRDKGILSNREAEILALLNEGLTNKAIGRRLDLAEPTVKFHLKNLYAKLGVGRRQLAVNVAKGSGLLHPDP